MHQLFHLKRVSQSREFFRVSVDEACQELQAHLGKQVVEDILAYQDAPLTILHGSARDAFEVASKQLSERLGSELTSDFVVSALAELASSGKVDAHFQEIAARFEAKDDG